jgi:E3 ubiquitin-protein ligase HUWE1
MYEGEYEDEMEYEEEPDDDEENISDEDEEIEGMGPIEGLSGEHGVDVEVILEDDDAEDDDDSSGEDDGEHDSDLEDDDARVEIIDEAGNVQQLGEEDDIGEWESDDDDDEEGEEEDYEGQAADQEDHVHAMDAMDAMAGGPLEHLVRALGGDEGAVDMLERMEERIQAEGIDPDDDEAHITGEYMEEVDDEGKPLFSLSSPRSPCFAWRCLFCVIFESILSLCR